MPNAAYPILAALALMAVATVQAAARTAVDGTGKAAPIGALHSCQAETPGKIDLEAAELLAELIGAPVFAAGGAEVGHVADICFDAQGRPVRLRVTTDATLGIGPRTVAVPDGTFIALRGAVALDLPPAAVRALPASAETGCDRSRPPP